MKETKNSKLMKDVIVEYHPKFKLLPELKQYGLNHPEIFNVERLVEESLAAVGGYSFVDEDGRDFDDSDDSDSKTVTVVNNSSSKNNKVFIIQNVQTKIGSLRVTCYNPFSNKVDYFYIPKKAVKWFKENNGTKSRESGACERIRTTWNESKDYYNKLELYRLKSFEKLAKAKG